ncbi:hypothetical protein [Novosphingobium sp. ERW19]|uniref:hypothetical protein n=1 Tax=Novosphingobium sp. ERW19 TaxID=2726186 RepID=UPI0017C1A61B|nr:hypothetical protein [Novosphingobium sp. ERW19]NLR39752.1 hypothetical protein [Novosphingobium sp. ERW19]
MRELLIRFAIVFSVLLAGMHFPAHAAQSRIDGDVEAYTCIDHGEGDTTGKHSAQPDDQAGEAAHHHHSPMAIGMDSKAGANDLAPTPSLHFPARATALTSRKTVPPLEPPLT